MIDANQTLSHLANVEQGGVGVLSAMIGAKNYVVSKKDSFVQFQFMRGAANKANRVKITLNSKDLYDVEFYTIRKCEVVVKETITDLYCDQLKSTFEDKTKLYLSL